MMNDRQKTVAAAIWRWREKKDKERRESSAERRKRALIESSVGLSIGAILFFATEKRVMACVVLGISSTVLMGGLFIPPIYYGFKKFGVFLAKVVGVGLSWILLVPFFYICFTTGRLVLLVSGKDPLARKFPTDMKSYWVKHKPPRGKESYERQY